MRDLLKLYGRMALVFVGIVLVLSIVQGWDRSDSQRIRTAWSRGA